MEEGKETGFYSFSPASSSLVWQTLTEALPEAKISDLFVVLAAIEGLISRVVGRVARLP